MSDDAAIRRANLRSLKLDPAALMLKAGRRYSYWRDLLTQDSKSFGEKIARSIEAALDLPRGWLDQPHAAGERPPMAIAGQAPTLPDAVKTIAWLGELLAAVPREQRPQVAPLLAAYAVAPDSADLRQDLTAALQGATPPTQLDATASSTKRAA